MKPRSSFRYRLEYAALMLFNGMLRALPARAACALGMCAGKFAAILFRSRVRLAHENLKIAYGDTLTGAQRGRIISKLFGMLGEGFVESIISTPEDVRTLVDIDGMEHIQNALSRGRGVIVLAPHLGVWELAAIAFGLHLEKAATLYKHLKNPYVDEYVVRERRKSNIELVSSRNGLRRLYSLLKQNAMVILLFDQNAGRSGLPVEFFGRVASTYATPAAFALKTGCAVMAGYIMKEPGFRRNRIRLFEPFPLIQTGDMEKDLLGNTRQYNAFFEQVVLRYPEQWFGWVHRRWKLPKVFTGPADQHSKIDSRAQKAPL